LSYTRALPADSSTTPLSLASASLYHPPDASVVGRAS